ncbi:MULTISPECIES: DUF551 domain-containing protein [unclassified Acinetobacter]|uniref:DUF551 domain-containing protein n=1 Tax=unclassified Acinetobacter TaxID=196816 RepID=UPI0025C27EB0|nr:MULTISPECIES: DUF551 domain-containing protein [unclassified Acinetobacter]
MSNWIDIEKVTPKKFQKVVAAEIIDGEIYAFAAAMFIDEGYFSAEVDGLEASNFDGGACINIDMNVTHWLILPEPPKADSEG